MKKRVVLIAISVLALVALAVVAARKPNPEQDDLAILLPKTEYHVNIGIECEENEVMNKKVLSDVQSIVATIQKNQSFGGDLAKADARLYISKPFSFHVARASENPKKNIESYCYLVMIDDKIVCGIEGGIYDGEPDYCIHGWCADDYELLTETLKDNADRRVISREIKPGEKPVLSLEYIGPSEEDKILAGYRLTGLDAEDGNVRAV